MNKGPVDSSFFQTLFLSWASLFVNARELINSLGSLVWHLCKLHSSKGFRVNQGREFTPEFSIVFLLGAQRAGGSLSVNLFPSLLP